MSRVLFYRVGERHGEFSIFSAHPFLLLDFEVAELGRHLPELERIPPFH